MHKPVAGSISERVRAIIVLVFWSMRIRIVCFVSSSFGVAVLVSVKVFRVIGYFVSVTDMPKIVRVGVTFPPELLKEFDEIIGKMGYESRSKAIQDAVSLFVSEKKWLQEEEKASQTGILLMVYDHEVRGLDSELTETQHHHSDLISSTMHIHLGERDCLEAIAVRGRASEIRHLSNELTTKRGVKILKTMIVSV